MPLKTLLTVTIGVLLFSNLFAFSFASKVVTPVFRDSAAAITIPGSNNSHYSRKISLVSIVTKKMAGWLNQIFPPARKKLDVKKAFGLASFIFALSWLITLVASIGDPASLVFFAGAIIFGITSLVLAGDRSESPSSGKGGRTKKKGRNTFALIGLLLPLALIVSVLIAYAVSQPK
jgi:hypothetical protein